MRLVMARLRRLLKNSTSVFLASRSGLYRPVPRHPNLRATLKSGEENYRETDYEAIALDHPDPAGKLVAAGG
jgi:hypothetical protein